MVSGIYYFTYIKFIMLKITVELLPFGNNFRKEILGTIYIWNTGIGGKELGLYRALIKEDGKVKKYVYGFLFERRKGFWKLLQKVLKQAMV